jgi:two-component system, LytTR family, response regulator
MTLRVVIADDEPVARRRLRRLLAAIPDVEVVGEAGDGARTIAAVEATRPDVVLLDIQMPEGDGLSVGRRLSGRRPLVVFVTAFDRFAVHAFDQQAVDYVLKPVSDVRLAAALDRARDRLGLLGGRARRWVERLAVRSEGQVHLVAVADIEWIEAAGNYAVLHAGRASHILRDTLARLERDLDPEVFVRIHRSTIVRLDRVMRLDVAGRGDYRVRLSGGPTLALSRTYRDRIERALGRRI